MKQDGFTLIELMVVVGILGILASMAIPKYKGYRARAFQLEAKGGLKVIFTGMTAYYMAQGDLPNTEDVAADNGAYCSYYGASYVCVPEFFGIPLKAGYPARYNYQINTRGNSTGDTLAWSSVAFVGAAGLEYVGLHDVWRTNANMFLCSMYNGVNGEQANVGSGPACQQTWDPATAGGLTPLLYIINNADAQAGTVGDEIY